MDKVKVTRSIGTYINSKRNSKPTASKLNRSKRTLEPGFGTSSYREDFKPANEWLESQASDFQEQARDYLEYHCNTPKVKYPHALRMKIIVEIWKKYNGKTNQTDFDYINKKELKPSKREEIIGKRKDFSGGLESEMEVLYLQGEV
jgi:hypothetical protein